MCCVAAAGFVKGWLESRDIEVAEHDHNGLPVLVAEVGAADRSTRPVRRLPRPPRRRARPARAVRAADRGRPPDRPRRLRHEGRTRRDDVRAQGRRGPGSGSRALRRACPTRSPRRSTSARPTRSSPAGSGGDFAITGEPTDMHIGVEAKGVLAMRIVVHGRAAHSSTPWLGDNAVLKAIDVFRAIETLPFSRESSEMFDRPSINLGRIEGGDALNKVPDRCEMAVDVRYLPGQDPAEILAQVRADPRDRGRADVHPPAGHGVPHQPLRAGAARAVARATQRRGDERRARRRLRRGVVHRGRASPRSSSGPPAAGTTGPRSGSRCRRWRATGGRSAEFVARAARAGWHGPAPTAGAPARRRSTGGRWR